MQLKLWSCLPLTLVAIGCGATTESESPDKSNAQNKPAADTAQIDVALKSWQETEEFIGTHKGKVVVVDLWATWWVVCIRELPELVQLHEEHKDQVLGIAVSLDYKGDAEVPPESYREAVQKVVNQKKIRCENILSTTPINDVLDAVESQFGLPVVLVYDKQGKRRETFSGGASYEDDIIPLVEKLLAE